MNQEDIVLEKLVLIDGFSWYEFWCIWKCLNGQKADFWEISQYESTYEVRVSTYEGHVLTYKCHVSTYKGYELIHASATHESECTDFKNATHLPTCNRMCQHIGKNILLCVNLQIVCRYIDYFFT